MTVDIDPLSCVIGGVVYAFPLTNIPLAEGRNLVHATPTGVTVASTDILRDDAHLPLWDLTVINGAVQSATDLRSIGGVGNESLQTGAVGLGNLLGGAGAGSGQPILDPNGNILQGIMSGPVQSIIGLDGSGVPTVGVGNASGTLPYRVFGLNFQSAISQNPNALDGTYLGTGQVVTRNVQSQTVISTQLSTLRYSTNLGNIGNLFPNGFNWTNQSLNPPAAVAPTDVLPAGTIISYDTGSTADAGLGNAQSDSLTIAASATVTVLFKHNRFVTGSFGLDNILFTGGSVSATGPIISNTVASGSSQSSITHATTSNTIDQSYFVTHSFPSSASISRVANPPSTTNQQNNGTIATTQSTAQSQAHTYPATSQVTVAGPGGTETITMTSWSHFTNPDPPAKPVKVQDGKDFTGGGSVSVSLPSMVAPVQNDPFFVQPNWSGSSAYGNLVAKLHRPDGTIATTWTNPASGAYLTYYNNAETQNGTWSLEITVVANANTDDGFGDTSVVTTQDFPFTSSIKYVEAITQTTYTNVDGATVTVSTTAAGTIAPTASATQLSLSLSSVVAPNNFYGNGYVHVQLFDPNGINVANWDKVVIGSSPLTYYSSGASAGAYVWKMYASCTNHGVAANFACNIAGTSYWYVQVANATTYTYTDNAGATSSVSTNPNTVAPTTSGVQLSLVIDSISVPTDANGSSAYEVQLYDPNGTLVGSWPNLKTTGTVTYSASGAVAGAYTWKAFAYVATDNHTNVSTYAGSMSCHAYWYQLLTTQNTTYYDNTGQVTSYTTPSTTVAPVGGSSANLIVDSDITNSAQWADNSGGTFTIVANGAPGGGNAFSFTGAGSASGFKARTSQIITVTPSAWYTLSAGIDASHCSGGNTPFWAIYAPGLGTQYAIVNASNGVAASRKQVQWQCPASGVTQVVILCDTANALVASGQTVLFYQPTFQAGQITSAPYVAYGAGTALTLSLTAVTTPSNAYGSAALTVQLYDPTGTKVLEQAGIMAAQAFNYSNASAISGAYTWKVFATVVDTQTGDAQYSCSWSGTHSWYQPGSSGGMVYVLAQDGTTQRQATTDANVTFEQLDPSTIKFAVMNSAPQTLTFTLAVDVHGI